MCMIYGPIDVWMGFSTTLVQPYDEQVPYRVHYDRARPLRYPVTVIEVDKAN